MSKSEEIAARAAKYQRIEREADTIGRIIGVRRLKPSETLRVEEMSPNLEGVNRGAYIDADTGERKEVEVPKRLNLFLAAAVCEVNSVPYVFPDSRAKLDAMLNMLDEEGLSAAMKALNKFAPPKEEEDKAPKDDKAFAADVKNF